VVYTVYNLEQCDCRGNELFIFLSRVSGIKGALWETEMIKKAAVLPLL